MEILSYKFNPIGSKMYIAIQDNEALVIDPCVNKNAEYNLNAHRVERVLILLTHEHCDHISGVNWFRKHFKTKVICSANCAENIKSSEKNFSQYFDILFMNKKNENYHMEAFNCYADEWFENEKDIKWHNHKLYIKETPGHSEGSIVVILDDKYAFTGDYLIPNQKVFTKIPGGSITMYQDLTKPYLDIIKDKYIILPGH